MINKDGRRIEENRQCLSQEVLATTTIPEKTAVMVSSLDGANLLLREPGKKKGRKTQRPVGSGAADDEKNTSFRNAMVGVFSFYVASQPILATTFINLARAIYHSRMGWLAIANSGPR